MISRRVKGARGIGIYLVCRNSMYYDEDKNLLLFVEKGYTDLHQDMCDNIKTIKEAMPIYSS
jgi:hypothetical protein